MPEADHVLRYIAPRHIQDGIVNGEGFLARPRDNNASSVNWMEWFDAPTENQVASIRAVARLTYAKTGKLVALNVGHTTRYINENAQRAVVLSLVHAPLDAEAPWPADPSHGLMQGVPAEDTPEAALVTDLIAECILPMIYDAAVAPEKV